MVFVAKALIYVLAAARHKVNEQIYLLFKRGQVGGLG